MIDYILFKALTILLMHLSLLNKALSTETMQSQTAQTLSWWSTFTMWTHKNMTKGKWGGNRRIECVVSNDYMYAEQNLSSTSTYAASRCTQHWLAAIRWLNSQHHHHHNHHHHFHYHHQPHQNTQTCPFSHGRKLVSAPGAIIQQM